MTLAPTRRGQKGANFSAFLPSPTMSSTAAPDSRRPRRRRILAGRRGDSPHAPALAGFNGTRRVPTPVNEPVKTYAPGSPERAALKARLAADGERADRHPDHHRRQGDPHGRDRRTAVMPHDHRHVLADYHKASATSTSSRRSPPPERARASGRNWAWEDRAAVFLQRGRAADDDVAIHRSTPRRCSASRRRCSRRRSTRRAS